MDRTEEKLNKLLDLLSMRSYQLLTYTEELELNHLLDDFPEYTPDYFEPIAALTDATMYLHDDQNLSSMPETLKRKIINDFKQEKNGSTITQILKNIFKAGTRKCYAGSTHQ